VTERPHATTVLGERLVLWRDSRRVVHAFRDVCVHRGTALSLGRVAADEIVCPYHGWCYRGDATCSVIPQLENPTRVPAKARVATYRSQERYGLVWVALDDPRWPLAEVPDREGPSWRTVRTGPFKWRCDASRQIENFTDFGHFAFVHEGLLGDPAQAVVAPYSVHAAGHVLRYEYVRPDAPNTEDFPVFAAEERKAPTRTTRYALHLPYTIVEHIDWGGDEKMLYFFASQPVAEDSCVGYCLVARNYNLDQPDEVMQAFERTTSTRTSAWSSHSAHTRCPSTSAPNCI
jgi:phenylpropionate dioxygenase-like ring-hydroxylating dioxygenase large terminal subunit